MRWLLRRMGVYPNAYYNYKKDRKAGCPYDNSPMESFYGTFQAKFIHKHRFSSDEEWNNATMNYVYVYDNYVRPHSANNDLTPFEKRM